MCHIFLNVGFSNVSLMSLMYLIPSWADPSFAIVGKSHLLAWWPLFGLEFVDREDCTPHLEVASGHVVKMKMKKKMEKLLYNYSVHLWPVCHVHILMLLLAWVCPWCKIQMNESKRDEVQRKIFWVQWGKNESSKIHEFKLGVQLMMISSCTYTLVPAHKKAGILILIQDLGGSGGGIIAGSITSTSPHCGNVRLLL